MYIKLEINDGIISGYKVRDICEIFGDSLYAYFEQRKDYDEYYYKYPTDIEVVENCIQILMDKGYIVVFKNDTMEVIG